MKKQIVTKEVVEKAVAYLKTKKGAREFKKALLLPGQYIKDGIVYTPTALMGVEIIPNLKKGI